MKTVVFDLDGTLADTSGDLLAAANACFADLGHPALLDMRDQLTAFHGGRAMLRLGFSRMDMQVDEAVISQYYPKLLGHYEDAIDTHTRLYEGAVSAIAQLRARGFATAICTNKPEYLAVKLIARLGITDFFDALIGADTLPTRKPDPAPYHAAVARAGGTRSILIGDTETDRLTARAAGVPSILVTFGPEGEDIARLSPEALLYHYDDLPQLAAQFLPD